MAQGIFNVMCSISSSRHSVDFVLRNATIPSHQNQVFQSCLCNQEPVERVAVMEWETARFHAVGECD